MLFKVRDFDGAALAGSDDVEHSAAVKDALPNRAEVLALRAEIEFTGESTTTAGSFQAADADTVLDFLLQRVKVDLNGEDGAVNCKPGRLRRYAAVATRRDATSESIGAGVAIPASGAGVKFYVPVVLPFYHKGLEHPNVNAQSGRQLNKHCEFKLVYKNPGAWTAGVALAGGKTLKVSNVKATLWVSRLNHERGEDFVAPSLLIRERTWKDNPETEAGPFFDLFGAICKTPSQADTDLGKLTVTDNGQQNFKNAEPSRMARAFGASQATMDGLLPLDITAGTNGLTPFHGVSGSIVADETEWPTHGTDGRTLEAANAPNETLFIVRVQSMSSVKMREAVSGHLKDLKRSIPFSELGVKGGGAPYNGLHADYKPVWLNRPTGAGKAA